MVPADLLGLIHAELRDEKSGPAALGASAHLQEILSVFDECAYSDAGVLQEAGSVRRLEEEVTILVIPIALGVRRRRRRCCRSGRRRVRNRSGALASRRERNADFIDARTERILRDWLWAATRFELRGRNCRRLRDGRRQGRCWWHWRRRELAGSRQNRTD